MPKDLPELIQKSKWSKPAKEVETWDQWWAMHQKILKPLQKTAKIINSWWSFTGIFGTQLQFFMPWFYKMTKSRKHSFWGGNKQIYISRFSSFSDQNFARIVEEFVVDLLFLS